MTSRRPMWVSHRGLRLSTRDENTLDAFARAIGHGFDRLETDLRVTADGEMILHHDSFLEDPKSGRRVHVEDLTYRDLSQLLASRPSHGPSTATRFCDFAASFCNSPWILDIKPESATRTAAALGSWMHREGLPRSYWRDHGHRFLCWDRHHERMLEQSLGDLTFYARAGQCWRAGCLTLASHGWVTSVDAQRIYALPPRLFGTIDLYQPWIVEAYQRRGVSVLAYLPTAPEDIERALAIGIDELLIDGAIPSPVRPAPRSTAPDSASLDSSLT